ncbi:MBL fold metallo-hydrolase [Engelhardtia mirabilis]|uniref:Ribonuclease Z n=1 Tax=Engelhardtia mirabilis TaxID=2528011 RepID=A0A518BKF6_9BACT|nr:Ribonuclease Z [Planctomycetes bacterium Pla133]QDV01788.1 Ribonuclease Z [Planctomycetes bacterium Pla86]
MAPSPSAELVVLGSGTILPRAGHGCSGYALRPRSGAAWTLVDCGPGTVRSLGAVGIGVEQIERVVLSHFHTDHCLDLFALAFARRNPNLGAVPQLEVLGPPGLTDLIERAPAALGRHVEDPARTVTELAAGQDGSLGFERADLVGEGHLNGHTPNALSWRLTLPGGFVLAYSGDSGPTPGLARAARGADLFLCESAFPDGEESEHHLTPTQTGRIATAAGARALLLTHCYPQLDPDDAANCAGRVFAGPIATAFDGLRVPLH